MKTPRLKLFRLYSPSASSTPEGEPGAPDSEARESGEPTAGQPVAGPSKPTAKLAALTGQTDPSNAADNRQAPMMPVAVRDLVPLLVDAFQSDRTWLKDFGQEQIQVSPDFYDILLAYQQLRRCDAA